MLKRNSPSLVGAGQLVVNSAWKQKWAVAHGLAGYSGTWKGRDWRPGEEGVKGRGTRVDVSAWANSETIFV